MTSRQTDRELLGEVACIEPGCGGVEYVYRSKRKGRHLYGRCATCGINQKTGANVQERLAAFVPVGTLGQQTPSEPSQTEPEPSQTEPQTDRETVQDFDPHQAPAVPDPAPRPKTGLFGLALGLLFLLSLPLAFIGAATK